MADLTPEERDELRSLTARKAWRSPRYRHLAARASAAATDRWRRDDVFGVDRKPFADEAS